MPKSQTTFLRSVVIIGKASIQTVLWKWHVWLSTGSILGTRKHDFYVIPRFSHVIVKRVFDFTFQISKIIELAYLKLVSIYDC